MTDWKEDILNWLDFYSSCEMLEAQGLEKKLIKIVEEVEDKARAEERSILLLELLQVFNDYDVPLTMTAEQVRDILEAYLTKKD